MTRLRKLKKVEGDRRSPRILALEATCINVQGPALHTRGKKKTKSKSLQKRASSPKQGVKHEDFQKKNANDQPTKKPSTSLPKKRILELVLDTLQRKDTYEIFAEPVDPNEVEDYYAIIKEPMDFGTMRAKLHEGMYKTLEQFEHDAFLIFNNAMDFNSSGTIYFRQARVINELAKKVFDVLRTNPDKFEMEFSEMRQQASRRNKGDFREATQTKITIDVPSRNASCSSQTTSSQKSFKTNHDCSNTVKRVNARDLEAPTGAKDYRRYRSFEVDRRNTYKPLSHHKDKSTYSTIYDKLKLLEHVNQQDIGYKDSLMSFVKDLGPTAQKIAKRKLLGCEIHTASSASVPQRPTNTCTMMSQFPYHPPHKKMKIHVGDIAENVDGRNTHQGLSLWGNKVFTNQINSRYSRACVEYLNGSNVLESREEKKCMFQSRPWSFDQDRCHMQKKNCPTNEVSYSFKTMETLKSDHNGAPLASGFVFNFPYLKTRLDQLNSSCNI